MLKLHTFTLSSADALWLKGVREGGHPVARTARSGLHGSGARGCFLIKTFEEEWSSDVRSQSSFSRMLGFSLDIFLMLGLSSEQLQMLGFSSDIFRC